VLDAVWKYVIQTRIRKNRIPALLLLLLKLLITWKSSSSRRALRNPDPEKPDPEFLQFPSRTQIALLVETGGPENHYALLVEPG
jgi:hypothetical protein